MSERKLSYFVQTREDRILTTPVRSPGPAGQAQIWAKKTVFVQRLDEGALLFRAEFFIVIND